MSEKVDVPALARWMGEFARAIAANKQLLTELDSALGDADHGNNMDRGMAAVLAALNTTATTATTATAATRSASGDQASGRQGSGGQGSGGPATLFKQVGMTLVSTVGGASGPLYGTFFLRMAATAGSAESLDGAAFGTALRDGLAGVVQRGKAERGDKTMVDALAPAIEALTAALAEGAGLGDALRMAAAEAEAGRDATTPMQARKGRASYLGQRSIGHQDPGATSAALLIASAATALGDVAE